jgi:hypothetical protein
MSVVKLGPPASGQPLLEELDDEPTEELTEVVGWTQPPATQGLSLKSCDSCVAQETAVATVPSATIAAHAAPHGRFVARARDLSRGDLMRAGVPF